MVDITIVHGGYFMVYQPTNLSGGPYPVQGFASSPQKKLDLGKRWQTRRPNMKKSTWRRLQGTQDDPRNGLKDCMVDMYMFIVYIDVYIYTLIYSYLYLLFIYLCFYLFISVSIYVYVFS